MSIRAERVAALIKEEIGAFLTKDFQDAEVGFVTVTNVRVSPDLKLAKIYVSFWQNKISRERALNRLVAHKRTMRHLIGTNVRLKFTPDLAFFIDDTMDTVERIETLIREIHKSQESGKDDTSSTS